MYQSKHEYKNALKVKQKDRQEYFSDELNDALKDLHSFWRTRHSKFSKTKTPLVIDGVCDLNTTAVHFAYVFKNTYVPNSPDKHHALKDDLPGSITGVICGKIFMLI